MTDQTISLGDNVCARTTVETRAAGVAGLVGTVFGETTPSWSEVDVIGELKSDYAINVYFEDRGEAFWFAPELLIFVDHGAGSEIRIKGVDKKWIRTESGEWEEFPGGSRIRSFWERLTGRRFTKR